MPVLSKVNMTSHKATLVTRMWPAGTAPANFISTLIGKASELVSKPPALYARIKRHALDWADSKL